MILDLVKMFTLEHLNSYTKTIKKLYSGRDLHTTKCFSINLYFAMICIFYLATNALT